MDQGPNDLREIYMQAHVRFGSKADMCSAKGHVRFLPIADISKLRSPRPWPCAQELVSAEVFGCFVTCVCFFEHTPSPLAIRPMLLKRHKVPLASFSGEKIAAVDVYGACQPIDRIDN